MKMRRRTIELPEPLTAADVVIREGSGFSFYVHAADVMAHATVDEETCIEDIASMIDVAITAGHPIVAVDVGCNYGFQLCYLARHIKQKTNRHHIIGLDPGLASQLVPYTLLKNGLYNDVEFIHAAAWDKLGCVEVYAADGNSLNNRILQGQGQTLRWIAPAVSLEQLFAKIPLAAESNAPLFVKIDTQGADPEVILGAGSYLPRLAFISEFTPFACGDRIDLLAFLTQLSQTHIIYNLRSHREARELIVDFADFLDKTYRTEPYWTDILCIPRMFPDLVKVFS